MKLLIYMPSSNTNCDLSLIDFLIISGRFKTYHRKKSLSCAVNTPTARNFAILGCKPLSFRIFWPPPPPRRLQYRLNINLYQQILLSRAVLFVRLQYTSLSLVNYMYRDFLWLQTLATETHNSETFSTVNNLHRKTRLTSSWEILDLKWF